MPWNDEPLTAGDLRSYLENQDDFAFERRIFTHAKGSGLTVEHAGVYEDPSTSKPHRRPHRATRCGSTASYSTTTAPCEWTAHRSVRE
jgi:hypothetical protein